MDLPPEAHQGDRRVSVVLETHRLMLRTWVPDDAEAAFRIWGDPDVMRYVDEPFASVSATRKALLHAAEAQMRHGVSVWPVVRKSDQSLIGCCGFHPFADGPALELAYHFVRASWGNGYATEAARACVQYAFARLQAPRIVATTRMDNEASRRVLEKLGFRYEGLVPFDGETERMYVATKDDVLPER